MSFGAFEGQLWMWILSQIIGGIAILGWFFIYQSKSKSRQLGLSSMNNVLLVAKFFLLGNMVRVGVSSVAFFKNITFSTTSRQGKTPKTLLWCLFLMFCAINTLVIYLTTEFWFDWLLLCGVFLLNYGKAFGGLHWVKIPVLFYNAIGLIYTIMLASVMGTIMHIMIITSIVVFYVRRYREGAKKQIAKPACSKDNMNPCEEHTCCPPDAQLVLK